MITRIIRACLHSPALFWERHQSFPAWRMTIVHDVQERNQCVHCRSDCLAGGYRAGVAPGLTLVICESGLLRLLFDWRVRC